jgi:predicted ABC-type ATPase
MFAGPNGSGKSVLKGYLPPELLGVYLNADEIEAEIRKDGGVAFHRFGIDVRLEEVLGFFQESAFLIARGRGNSARRLGFVDGWLDFSDVPVDSYFASVLVDFLRTKLLALRKSFTFETVMSHRSKVSVLEKSQAFGYRTYLYYVATDDPAINISRVKNRVKLNGHDVPSDVVEKRYYRSLDLLVDAIRCTNRAYIFDNSTDNADKRQTWLAEITEGKFLVVKTKRIPDWFRRAVLEKTGECQLEH